MEQVKKRGIPEVLIQGSQFRVVVDDAPHAGNGRKPSIGGRQTVTTEESSPATETVVKTGRIPQHSWGA